MTQNRALIAVPAFVVLVIAAVILVVTIQNRSSGPPTQAGRRSGSSHGPSVRAPRPDSDEEDGFGENASQPEPNVTGVVVDEEGRPVEGADVGLSPLVPHLMTQYRLPEQGFELNLSDPFGEDEFGGGMPGSSEWDSLDDKPSQEAAEGDDADPVEAWLRSIPPLGPGSIGLLACETDAKGRFAFFVPETIWFRLDVHAQGYRTRSRAFRERETGIRLVLYGPGSIAGQVVDAESGEPVKRYSIQLVGRVRGSGRRPILEMKKLVENGSGEFLFDGVPRNVEGAVVEAEGYVTVEVDDIEPVPGRVQRVSIRMHKAARLVGEVLWASNGQPVSDAALEIRTGVRTFDRPYDLSPPLHRLNQDGTFDLRAIPAGKVTIAVIKEYNGHFPDEWVLALLEQDVLLPAGETTTVVLRVADEPGEIRGRVIDGWTGEPIRGIEVSLCDQYAWVEGAPKPSETVSDEDGRFEFVSLAPGARYFLSASHPDYAAKDVPPMTLGPGQVADGVVIELREWARLVGRVQDGSGRPVQAWMYCLTQGGGNEETDEEGNYAYEKVAAGTTLITCTLQEDSGTTEERLVDLAPGETTRVDFTFAERFSVSGGVTIAGAPVQDTAVRLLSDIAATTPRSGHREHRAKTDGKGRFQLKNVRSGRYTLFVEPVCSRFRGGITAQKAVTVAGTDVELALQLPAGTVSGRILSVETNEPIARATVYIQEEDMFGPGNDNVLEWHTRLFVLSDSYTGRYSFQAIGDGRYSIVASKDGLGTARIQVDVIGGEPLADTDIRLGKGYEVTGTIKAADPQVRFQEATITVRDASGQVILDRGLHPSFHGYELGRRGEYTLGYLPPGEYVFEANSPETAGQEVRATVSEHGDNVVDFRLPTGNTLVAEVTNPKGEPVRGAVADVKDPQGQTQKTSTGYYLRDWYLSFLNASDGKGVTRVEHLLPGSYTLTVRAAGYRTAEQQVEVLDAGETRVKVVLERVREE